MKTKTNCEKLLKKQMLFFIGFFVVVMVLFYYFLTSQQTSQQTSQPKSQQTSQPKSQQTSQPKSQQTSQQTSQPKSQPNSQQTSQPKETNYYQDSYLTRLLNSTRPVNYTQMGMLRNESTNDLLPLYGKLSPTHRYRWNYYTMTDKLSDIRMPVYVNDRDCTLHLGCNELYTNDTVYVPAMNSNYTVTVYENEFRI